MSLRDRAERKCHKPGYAVRWAISRNCIYLATVVRDLEDTCWLAI